jgi:cytidine deaminase
MKESIINKKSLIKIAIDNLENSYAPYSHYNVSAAVVMGSFRTYTGVNVENASYPAGICAERNAIFSAINCGEKEILSIAVVGGREYSIKDYCVPCGICRQVIREFCRPRNVDIIIAKSVDDFKVFTLDQLLPLRFGPSNLLN